MLEDTKTRRGKDCHQFLDRDGQPVPDRLVKISNLGTLEAYRFQLTCNQRQFHHARARFLVRRRLGDILIVWQGTDFRYRFTAIDCPEFRLRHYDRIAVEDVNPLKANTGTDF